MTGSRYEARSKETLDNALALVKAGYTPDDARRVVVSKVNEWQADPKMQKFLRPGTLLRPSKFRVYAEDVDGRGMAPRRVSPAAVLQQVAEDLARSGK